MNKIAVVYWSGTGNTEAMASAVAEGAREKGRGEALITAAGFSADQVGDYDAIAFGCPSMASEHVEETEFEPMFASCEGALQGKTIALFVPMAGRRGMDARLGGALQSGRSQSCQRQCDLQ